MASQRVERYLARNPGASIAEARGHGKTPEHPGRGFNKPEFREYYDRRAELERRVNEQKNREYNSSPKWNQDRSERAVAKHTARSADMEAYLNGTLDWDEVDYNDERWAWLRYH